MLNGPQQHLSPRARKTIVHVQYAAQRSRIGETLGYPIIQQSNTPEPCYWSGKRSQHDPVHLPPLDLTYLNELCHELSLGGSAQAPVGRDGDHALVKLGPQQVVHELRVLILVSRAHRLGLENKV